jgi:hypothetical protein
MRYGAPCLQFTSCHVYEASCIYVPFRKSNQRPCFHFYDTRAQVSMCSSILHSVVQRLCAYNVNNDSLQPELC